MKDSDQHVMDVDASMDSMQSALRELQDRVAKLELIQSRPEQAKLEKSKKSKKKHKLKKSERVIEDVIQTVQATSVEQLAATIVRFHKDPRKIAQKIARQEI